MPEPARVVLDGRPLDPSQMPLVRPSANDAELRYLDLELNANPPTFSKSIPLSGSTVIFAANGGIRLGLFLNDLTRRSFLERYAPANLEFDQSPMSITIELTGARSLHHLFANGAVSEIAPDAWKIEFPATSPLLPATCI